jgi:sugar/nucleoside kinase (ribokinase family)
VHSEPLGATGVEADYVLVGHVSRDLFDHEQRLGGTVLYAGIAAARLGRRVGIVTAFEESLEQAPELDGLAIARVPSEYTTTFEIQTANDARVLRLRRRAAPIAYGDVPSTWRAAPIVHLAPIADEVDPGLARWFSSSWIGATAQGWLRQVAADGTIIPAAVDFGRLPTSAVAALVVSRDDLADPTDLARLTDRVACVVVTRGAEGCTVHLSGEGFDVPAFPASEVDPTGAGDVFAAAFFVYMSETRDALASARFAACAAALSIEQVGAAGIPTREEILTRIEMAA